MYSSKSKVCDDSMMQPSGGFEDDTFRHLLSEKRTILINNTISDNIIERVVIPIISINEMDDELEDAKSFNRKDHPIKIFINTAGGAATETLSAISAIEQSKTPVHTFGLAKVFSGGFYMLAAGHKRFCQVYSTLMYHQIQTGLPHSDMTTSKEHIEEAIRMQIMLDSFILRRTKLKQKQINDMNSKKVDWYLNSQDAIKFGIVDGIYY